MYITRFNIRGLDEQKRNSLAEKMTNIMNRDETFKFRIMGNYLLVFSKERDKALKRGGWIQGRVDEVKGFNFNVFWGEVK